MATNYGTLTGSTVGWINALPWLLVVAAAAGALVAIVRRRAQATDIDSVLDADRRRRLTPIRTRKRDQHGNH